MKTQIKAYWEGLNHRERWVLAVGIGCCVVYLFYLLVYSPLTTAVYRKAQALLEKQQTLVWMEDVSQHYKPKKARQALASSQLLTVIAEQINTSSFKQFPYQLQQTGANDVQLIFDQVPYHLFLIWLQSLSEQYRFTLQQLTVEKTEISGVVKLKVLLGTN